MIVFDRLFMVFDCCSWCFYYFDTWLRLVVLRSYVKVSGLVVFVFMFLWFVCCLVCVMRVVSFVLLVLFRVWGALATHYVLNVRTKLRTAIPDPYRLLF